MATIPAVQTQVGFLKKKSQLDPLIRRLQRYSVEAIDSMYATMESTKDEKMKLSCAKALLAFHMQALKDRSNEEIERLKMQIQLLGNSGNDSFSTAEEEDEDDIPTISFNDIVEP